jgi:chemotaxis protein histidine kinase CheA
MGLRFAFARSGARKGDGNPHLPLDQAAFDARQAHCDALATLFFEHVAEMRGVSADEIKALEAGVFLGAEALSRRLIDGVSSWSEIVSGAIGDDGGKPMAKKLTEYLASLAEGEDKEEAKKAKKALAALLAEDEPDGDEPKKEEAAAAKAEDAPKKEEAKAEDEKKDEMKAAASAAIPQVASLARELHALKAERAAEVDAKARAAIFASRPDLNAETVKALASVPTGSLQSVVDTFPRIPVAAVAAQAIGTVGAGAGGSGETSVPAHIADVIDIKMGLAASKATVANVGTELHLGAITQDQARARLAELSAANGGK